MAEGREDGVRNFEIRCDCWPGIRWHVRRYNCRPSRAGPGPDSDDFGNAKTSGSPPAASTSRGVKVVSLVNNA